jgi:hypothetical protein
MSSGDPATIILQGAEAWNAWREANRGSVNFPNPNWYYSPGPGGIAVKGRNQLDFSRMNLSDLLISRPFAEGLNLKGASFTNTHIEEGDFSRANFAGATFRNTTFNKTIFTGASFSGARLVNCNLNRVNLVEADFRVEEITETVVYGISAWDMQTAPNMRQSKLVIEKTSQLYSDLIARAQIPMMVDDIELAQFIHYLSNHKKLRDTLNILTHRGVLLLGRFKNGGLDRLYRLREWLAAREYLPMIFDFERPDTLDLVDTIVTLAGLSKFVIADLSGPRVPGEVRAILRARKLPVLAFGDLDAIADLRNDTNVLAIEGGEAALWESLDSGVNSLERLHLERVNSLAREYAALQPPPAPV